MSGLIEPRALRARLAEAAEMALLDVREQARFGEGHLLAAACLPLSTLEVEAARRLPRRETAIVVIDGGEDGDAMAHEAAARLRTLGYTDVQVLAGGVPAWAGDGGEVFRGFNVVSKAFGEWVEHEWGIEALDAVQLDQWRTQGTPHLLFDSRPLDEHLRVRVPGAAHCPGVELPWRVPGLLPDAHTPVVVHCAGRTRSIIGACLLRMLGLPNPVRALRNGTMGWELAGLKTEAGGESELVPAPASAAARFAPQIAALRERCGVARIGAEQLRQWRAEGSRTCYSFDVRTAQEHLDGHPEGFLHAPGGQLLQQLDEFAPVRRARIVLTADDTMRADCIAVLLWQMGCDDVAVIGLHEAGRLRSGPEPALRWRQPGPAQTISPSQLAQMQAQGEVGVIDLSPSPEYRRAHVAGAWFAVRSRLATALQPWRGKGPVVLTSSDGEAAAWAASVEAGLPVEVRVLAGGNREWAAQGHALTAEGARWADEPDDVYVLPYDYQGDVAAQMQAYIDWELALVAQLRRDGTVRFRPVPAAH